MDETPELQAFRAETRAWLVRGLASAQLREGRARFVDTW